MNEAQGVCAPLLSKINAMVSPSSWKNPRLPENILPFLPKYIQLIQLLPKSQKI